MSPQCRTFNNIYYREALGWPAVVWKSPLFLNPSSWQANDEEVDQSSPLPWVVTEKAAIKVLSFFRGLLRVLFVIEKSSKLVNGETNRDYSGNCFCCFNKVVYYFSPLIAIIKIHSLWQEAFKQGSLRICTKRILNENVQLYL